MRRRPRQLELRPPPTWGGRRAGAGRKPASGRRCVPHRRRGVHDPRCPVHVTLRACSNLPSLRRGDVFGATRAAFAKSSSQRFRLLHFSVQRDHVHLLLEGDGPNGLRRGIQGLAIRVAKAINRALGRRGKVWADRYHSRALKTPREVRHALVYVLQNWRKHLTGVRAFDPRSSAAWFTGWLISAVVPPGPPPVAAAQTWLASVGWRRLGLVRVEEAPRPQLRR
jgi:REP element-mobilizing transposase RayT